MLPPERPCLRPGLAIDQDRQEPHYYYLFDRLHLSDSKLRLSWLEVGWAQLLDGRRSLREVQAEAMRQLGGSGLPLEMLHTLVARLDEATFLDGPRYRERLTHPVREPACIHYAVRITCKAHPTRG